MSKKIYVGNLSFRTTEEELAGLFEQIGAVESVSIITDRDTGRSKGDRSFQWQGLCRPCSDRQRSSSDGEERIHESHGPFQPLVTGASISDGGFSEAVFKSEIRNPICPNHH